MPRRRTAFDGRVYQAMLERTVLWTNQMLRGLAPALQQVHRQVLAEARRLGTGRGSGGLTLHEVEQVVPEQHVLQATVVDATYPTFRQAYWCEGTLQMEAVRQAVGYPAPKPALTEENDGDAIASDGRGNLVLFGAGLNLHVDHWQEMPVVMYYTDLRTAEAAAHELRTRQVAKAQVSAAATRRVDAQQERWQAEGQLARNVRPAVFVLRFPREHIEDLEHLAPGLWQYRRRRGHYGVAYDLMSRRSEDALLRVWRELYTPAEDRRASADLPLPGEWWSSNPPAAAGGIPPAKQFGEMLDALVARSPITGKAEPVQARMVVEPFRNFPGDPTAAREMDGHHFRFAGKVSTHLRGQLTQQFRAGITAGENMAALQERVRGVFEGKDPMRSSLVGAERIARTESQRALVTAQQHSYKQMGIHGLRKRWLNAGDERVRDEHGVENLDLLDQEPLVDETFDVMGVPMLHPLDPTAPAYLVVRCRCTTLAVTPKGEGLPANVKLEAFLDGRLALSSGGLAPGVPEQSLRDKWKRADVEGRKALVDDTVRKHLPAEVEDAQVQVVYREFERTGERYFEFQILSKAVKAVRRIELHPNGTVSGQNGKIAVDEASRGQGIATSIYRAGERVYEAAGVGRVWTQAMGMGVRVWSHAKFSYRVGWSTRVHGTLNRWLREQGWGRVRREAYTADLQARAESTGGLLAADIDRGFWESGLLSGVNLYRNLPQDTLGF